MVKFVLTRVVQDPPNSGHWISIQEWRRKQAAIETANARIPDKREDFDYTFKAPSGQRLPYDFTF